MNQKEFLAELEEAVDFKEKFAKKIKSHNLPVIIFGAGKFAKIITEELENLDVKVSGYALDEPDYYKAPKYYLDLPVYNFDELVSTDPKKYVFVLGIGLYRDSIEGVTIKSLRINNFVNDPRIISYAYLPAINGFERWRVGNSNYEYIKDNIDKFLETYEMFEDNFSRKTMLAYLRADISGSVLYLSNVLRVGEWFNELNLDFVIGGTFIDCGAFTGDTVEKFVNFTNNDYKKIYAIEADPKNFTRLERFIKDKEYKNVECINCGVWNEKGTISFSSRGSVGSMIVDSGDVTVPTDTIDNIVNNQPVTLIKMNIEGAELNALKGALNTLKNYRPSLAFSAYHRREDLITLPQFIKDVYKDCKIYLRMNGTPLVLHGYFNLYVVPN